MLAHGQGWGRNSLEKESLEEIKTFSSNSGVRVFEENVSNKKYLLMIQHVRIAYIQILIQSIREIR